MPRYYWKVEVFLLSIVSFSASTSEDPADVLSAKLFLGYNQYVSPFVHRENASNTMDVFIRLSHVTIAEVDEQDFTISVLVTVNYQWNDRRFRWNPSENDGITRIAVKTVSVWQPDVYPCESTAVTVLTADAMSALINYDGHVIQDIELLATFNCPMDFDAFPFDRQNCQICFALDGFSGSSVNLIDTPPDERYMLSNSEWDFVGNMTSENIKSESDGLQTDTVKYRFQLDRRSFFWVYLIVVPSCLICIVALFGIFFSHAEEIVENAVSIGLNTMTSLMLAVTILADFLAKTNNLPGLGWFVLMDIVIVCVSVVAILIIDHSRTAALEWAKKRKKEHIGKYTQLLLTRKSYRITRVVLFLLAILALTANVILNWTGREM